MRLLATAGLASSLLALAAVIAELLQKVPFLTLSS